MMNHTAKRQQRHHQAWWITVDICKEIPGVGCDLYKYHGILYVVKVKWDYFTASWSRIYKNIKLTNILYGRETYSNIKSYLTKHIDTFYIKTYSLLYYNTRILYILYRYSIRVSVRALSVRKLKFPRNLCEENSTLTNKYFHVINRTVTRSELGALRFLDFGLFYEKFTDCTV